MADGSVMMSYQTRTPVWVDHQKLTFDVEAEAFLGGMPE